MFHKGIHGSLVLTGLVLLAAEAARAGVLLVAGSPTYDPATGTGLRDGSLLFGPGWVVNNRGTAVGHSEKYVNGSDMGPRPVRWDASGTAATELGNLGTDSSGSTYAVARALNAAGTAVGYSVMYVNGSDMGPRAVRWDASGTAAAELGNLGTNSSGYTYASAWAMNDAGTVVGYSRKYVGDTDKGMRAVRWDASGTAATELGNLGTNSSGYTYARPYAVNDAGTVVGYCGKYGSGRSKGDRAVRWDASGTVTELGNLGTSSTGYTDTGAGALNAAGTVVGRCVKYVNGSSMGSRAVRWDASRTTATELGNLGTDASGVTSASALAVNDSGTAVGYSRKYVSGTETGERAVRWDASGTAATELGNLGTDAYGVTSAGAYAVNGSGTAVGQAAKYVDGSSLGYRAVIWLPDARAVDLNDLGIAPVPAGGSWTLNRANALSADGWMAGQGMFDPDGPGPLASYMRHWVAQVGLGGTWTSAAGGTWGRGPNWSTGTPAMQVGAATFDLPAAYTVSLDRDETTVSVAIAAGSVTLDLAGHTLTTESGLSVAGGAKLFSAGAGTLQSDLVNAGTLAPGTGPGTLHILGDLTNTGTLELEIAGLASHDRIDLTGELVAGGTIAVKLMGGYSPALGDRFDLVDFGAFTNAGYTLDLSAAPLPPDRAWDTSTFATTGAIGVVPEPASIALLLSAAAAGLIWWQGSRGHRRQGGLDRDRGHA